MRTEAKWNEGRDILELKSAQFYKRMLSMCLLSARHWVPRYGNTKMNKDIVLSLKKWNVAYWLKGWPPEFEAWLHSLWTLWSRASCLSFLICKNGDSNIPYGIIMKINWVNIRPLKHCLLYNKGHDRCLFLFTGRITQISLISQGGVLVKGRKKISNSKKEKGISF